MPLNGVPITNNITNKIARHEHALCFPFPPPRNALKVKGGTRLLKPPNVAAAERVVIRSGDDALVDADAVTLALTSSLAPALALPLPLSFPLPFPLSVSLSF